MGEGSVEGRGVDAARGTFSFLPGFLTKSILVPKFLVLTLSIFLPLFGFWVGLNYQRTANFLIATSVQPPVATITNESSAVSPTVTPILTVSESDLPPDVDNTSLYYVDDSSRLYKQSSLTGSPSVVLNKVESYAFSPNLQYLAYIKEYGPDSNNDIRVLKLSDQTEKIFQGSGFDRGVSWSPGGKYILVESGTGAEGALTVYKFTTGERLSSFGDGPMVWLDDENVVMSKLTQVNPPRPNETDKGSSLAKVNVVTGKFQILMPADESNDYGLVSVKGNCLEYSHDQVQTQDQWEDLDWTKSPHFCFDLKTQTGGLPVPVSLNSDATLLESQIRQILPDYKPNFVYPIIIRNEKFPDWIIMDILHEDSVGKSFNDIVIFNRNDPKGTYRKLATGSKVSWY